MESLTSDDDNPPRWWVHPYLGTIEGAGRGGEPVTPSDDALLAPRLCACCALLLVTSEVEWFCSECSLYLANLNREFSQEIVPLKRHAVQALATNDSDTTARRALSEDEVEVARRLDHLVAWSHAVVTENCARLGMSPAQPAPLSEYLERSNSLANARLSWWTRLSCSALSALLETQAAAQRRATAIARASEAEPPCAACGHTGVAMWRDLRFACEEPDMPDEGIPQGGLGDQIEGHLPLCGACLPACPTCKAAVPAPDVDTLVEKIRSDSSGRVRLDWWAGTCDDPHHERPAIPAHAPPRIPDDAELERSRPSDDCNLRGSAGDRHVGDLVEVEGDVRIGVIKYLYSHRLSGGIVATIQFGDGSWARTRLDRFRVVASLTSDVVA